MYFKVLRYNGSSPFTGTPWHLPVRQYSYSTNYRKGRWMQPVVDDLRPCSNGYHLVNEDTFALWLEPGSTIYLAEGKGDRIDNDDKVVFRTARLIRPLAPVETHTLVRIGAQAVCDVITTMGERAAEEESYFTKLDEVAHKVFQMRYTDEDFGTLNALAKAATQNGYSTNAQRWGGIAGVICSLRDLMYITTHHASQQTLEGIINGLAALVSGQYGGSDYGILHTGNRSWWEKKREIARLVGYHFMVEYRYEFGIPMLRECYPDLFSPS